MIYISLILHAHYWSVTVSSTQTPGDSDGWELLFALHLLTVTSVTMAGEDIKGIVLTV